jgi:hypothetical protein
MRTPGLEVWLLVILGVTTCLMRYFHDLHRYCRRRASTWDPVMAAGTLEKSPALLGFSVVSILGVTLAVSLFPQAPGAIDPGTAATAGLLATLATMAGLYLGGRAAEPAPALRRPPSKTTPAANPKASRAIATPSEGTRSTATTSACA